MENSNNVAMEVEEVKALDLNDVAMTGECEDGSENSEAYESFEGLNGAAYAIPVAVGLITLIGGAIAAKKLAGKGKIQDYMIDREAKRKIRKQARAAVKEGKKQEKDLKKAEHDALVDKRIEQIKAEATAKTQETAAEKPEENKPNKKKNK